MTVNAGPVESAVPPAADVVVIGDGVIGLSTALEIGRSGGSCVLVGQTRPGSASGAAAGLLAPSIGRLADDVRTFFFASLDRFPAFLQSLHAFDPTLAIIRGLIGVSAELDPANFRDDSQALTAADVALLDPALRAPQGARLYDRDGAIDNVRLIEALRRAVPQSGAVYMTTHDPAVSVAVTPGGCETRLRGGGRVHSAAIVLAAGAWSNEIAGLPRRLPVSPLKGQMLALTFSGLGHPVMAGDVYIVPRGAEVAIGATAERAGFDITVHPDAIEGMRRAATAVCPELSNAPMVRSWAGLRPATPDMLPIICRDPQLERLIYACGHSKNGILLAPATAQAVVALAQNRPVDSLSAFSIERFKGQ